MKKNYEHIHFIPIKVTIRIMYLTMLFIDDNDTKLYFRNSTCFKRV